MSSDSKRAPILKRVTLRDIAAKAGVHYTTISMALRNHPSIPVETRVRLQKLAREMAYQPDPMLTALGTYRRAVQPTARLSTLAYLGCYSRPEMDEIGPVAVSVLKGCQERSEELGFNLEYIWMKEPGISTARWNKILYTRNPAGIIIAPMPEGRSHLRIDFSRFPAVKIEQALVWPRLHALGNNQYKCIQLGMREAHRLGYRRMGLAMRQAYNEQVDRLWSAGLWAEQEYYPSKNWVRPYLPRELNLTTFSRWMKKERPEVIFTHHYRRIPAYLQQLGYSIPDDVGVIDLDLQEFSGARAGIRQNHAGLGAATIDQLVSLIQRNERGFPQVPRLTLLEGSWFFGNSVKRR